MVAKIDCSFIEFSSVLRMPQPKYKRLVSLTSPVLLDVKTQNAICAIINDSNSV